MGRKEVISQELRHSTISSGSSTSAEEVLEDWIETSRDEEIVVAIANLPPEKLPTDTPVPVLSFCVGEVLHTTHKYQDWYFGYYVDNRSVTGIFPRCFVKAPKAKTSRPGSGDEFDPRDDPIVEEMCTVLREWHPIWKQRFVSGNSAFAELQGMMLELLKMRREILFAKQVTVERMMEIKQRTTYLIDLGNVKLGLDVVVRDEKGHSINPEKISAIELFRLLEKIAVITKTRKELRATAHPSVSAVSNNRIGIRSYKLSVKLNGFVTPSNMKYRFQLLIMLYQMSRSHMGPITEPLVVEWNVRESYLSLDGTDTRNSVLFTDLNVRDLEKEKRPHIVVFLVRIGTMDAVPDPRKRGGPPGGPSDLRRPFGVAVRDLSDVLAPASGNAVYKFGIEDTTASFLLCGEKESLVDVLHKGAGPKSVASRAEKSPEVRLSLYLYDKDGEDSVTLQERNAQEGRKLGFPEVVLPEYFRSDIFITLVSGEFAKSKNIEVDVSVHDEEGNRIENVVYMGAGAPPSSEYRSIVYYHEDKPKWSETIRIELQPELFSRAHVRFSFKHRSRNEPKEKQTELPFAISYLRFVDSLQDGTILRDGTYDLAVYRLTSVGEKSWTERDASYTDEHQGFFPTLSEGMKLTNKKFSLNPKESFRVSTVICSTKLTNDLHLMALLKWKDNIGEVNSVLKELRSVNPAEIVKFLRDTLDSIFGILMDFADDVKYDEEVFDALVHVICKMNEVQYEHFKGVMNSYIEESFHAALAHRKLLRVLRNVIVDRSELQSVMKALHFLFKFIVKSRQLYVQSPLTVEADDNEFDATLFDVFKSMADLMKKTIPEAQVSQCLCLKHLPQTTSDLVKVLDPVKLSECWAGILKNVKRSQRSTQFLTTMRELVTSELFREKKSRSVLLPVMCKKIQERLSLENETQKKPPPKALRVLFGTEEPKTTIDEGLPEEMDVTVKLLGDILDFLWRSNPKEVEADVRLLVDELLKPIVKLIFPLSEMERYQPILEFLVVALTSLLRQMTTYHFECMVERMNGAAEDFLMQLLDLFIHLITKPVFPKQWGDMMILVDHVILRTLRCIGSAMKDRFLVNLSVGLWEKYFRCAVRFITDPALQLETFTPTKRKKINARYRDMRKAMADEVRSMWFSLEMQKIRFIPRIVRDFLEMTLVPDPELRRETIPIFFDMMLCEFCSPPPVGDPGLGYVVKASTVSIGDGSSQGGPNAGAPRLPIRGNFKDFHDELIGQLDSLVEGGKGDDHYRHIFREILVDMCGKNKDLQRTGPGFVNTVSALMEKLLMYRAAVSEESVNNVMNCAEILLEFYGSMEQWKLHLKYLYKLFDLHQTNENHTEAAYTLLVHYKRLPWANSKLSMEMAPPRNAGLDVDGCRTLEQLKFKLAYTAMALFDKSQMWEPAVALCKDIGRQCEEQTYNYAELSTVLDMQSKYVRSVVTKERFDAEYYRVAFYGRGFPAFLQNKEFVSRGSVFERLSDFQARIMNQFPKAELMRTLDEPSQDVMDSPCQKIQINQVSPVENLHMFGGKKEIDDKILHYYHHNEVDTFMYFRVERKSTGATSKNEFAMLWKENIFLVTRHKLPGILLWFPVVKKWRKTLRPIQTAEEAMRDDNDKLQVVINLFEKHQRNQTTAPPKALNELDLLLGGRLDAAVMGGIKNYEEAFFTTEYLEANPDDGEAVEKVKRLIIAKMEKLGRLVDFRALYVKEDLKEWFTRMRGCYVTMKEHVLKEYGELIPEESSFREEQSSSFHHDSISLSVIEEVSVKKCTTASSSRPASHFFGSSNDLSSHPGLRLAHFMGVPLRHSGSWSMIDGGGGQNSMTRAASSAWDTLTRKRGKKLNRFTSTNFGSEPSSQWYTPSPEEKASASSRRKSSMEPDNDSGALSASSSRVSLFEVSGGNAPPLPHKNNRNSDVSLSRSTFFWPAVGLTYLDTNVLPPEKPPPVGAKSPITYRTVSNGLREALT